MNKESVKQLKKVLYDPNATIEELSQKLLVAINEIERLQIKVDQLNNAEAFKEVDGYLDVLGIFKDEVS